MNDESAFIEQVGRELDQRVAATPAHISSRLNAARHAALESRNRKQGISWLPTVATTALMFVVVSGLWFTTSFEQNANDATLVALVQNAEDFEMLTHNEPFELYAEMEFYDWLEQQAAATS